MLHTEAKLIAQKGIDGVAFGMDLLDQLIHMLEAGFCQKLLVDAPHAEAGRNERAPIGSQLSEAVVLALSREGHPGKSITWGCQRSAKTQRRNLPNLCVLAPLCCNRLLCEATGDTIRHGSGELYSLGHRRPWRD